MGITESQLTVNSPAQFRWRLWLGLLATCLLLTLGVGFGWRAWHAAEIQQVVDRCQSCAKAGDWKGMLPAARRWTTLAPQSGDAWLQLAEAGRRNGDLETTAAALLSVPAEDRRALKSLGLRGDLLLDGLGRPDEAIRNWQLMLERSPANEVAHQRLIYVYAMTLQRQKMNAQIYDAIRAGAEPPEAYGYLLASPNLVFSDGFVRLREWLKQSPDHLLLQVAFAVYAARTAPSKAIRMFGTNSIAPGDEQPINELLKSHPECVEVLAFHVERAVLAGDIKRIGELLAQLPAEAEQDSRFWRYQGTVYDSQRRYEEAAESLMKSISLFPLDWRSHHELSSIERSRGNAAAAARHADLGQRGKQLERQVLELPNAAQAGPELLHELWQLAKDCGDQVVVDGLGRRLGMAK